MADVVSSKLSASENHVLLPHLAHDCPCSDLKCRLLTTWSHILRVCPERKTTESVGTRKATGEGKERRVKRTHISGNYLINADFFFNPWGIRSILCDIYPHCRSSCRPYLHQLAQCSEQSPGVDGTGLYLPTASLRTYFPPLLVMV